MKTVSVTELAKMAKCERQAVLDRRFGDSHSAVREAAERGTAAHLAFAARLSGEDRRCFIATAIFGTEAWQTIALRRWRDERLLEFPGGAALVAAYYRYSPRALPLLQRRQWLRRGCRCILNAWIAWWKL